ncbi:hypothetical protein [Chitinimonas lacunae]|uniref:Macro domain-containing protein n=1 Tax=Chitinimonas lacunae TaxID=1963018 RepID=A0ABV8MMK4_9NEIS
MIETAQGSPFEADVEALVNTIDAAGHAMGRAGQRFKKAFPDNAALCLAAGRARRISPEQIVVYGCHGLINPRYLLNLAIVPARHSEPCVETLQASLAALSTTVRRLGINSLALTAPCGLAVSTVHTLLSQAFAELPEVRVLLFESDLDRHEPKPAYPPLTPARAMLLALVDDYAALGYPQTAREVQTLAYFLQEAGEPLRLYFEPADHGLTLGKPGRFWAGLDGHYLRHDESNDTYSVQPEVREAVRALIGRLPDSQRRLSEVSRLIESYETPYGLALLSAVHWVAHRGGRAGELPATDQEMALRLIQRWQRATPYRFTASHINQAWNRLARLGWLSCLQGGDERQGEPA